MGEEDEGKIKHQQRILPRILNEWRDIETEEKSSFLLLFNINNAFNLTN